jgi:methionyl-tRNA synthetase
MITIEEFRKLEMKVGKVVEAAEHPNATKLLVLKVDIGEPAPRQLVAGIKGHYAPDQLVGKSVVVLANLQPALLRGVESQGMILACTNGADVVLLTTDRAALPGSPVS